MKSIDNCQIKVLTDKTIFFKKIKNKLVKKTKIKVLRCHCGVSEFRYDSHHDLVFCPDCGTVVMENNILLDENLY